MKSFLKKFHDIYQKIISLHLKIKIIYHGRIKLVAITNSESNVENLSNLELINI